MVTQITKDIKISVEIVYKNEFSDPGKFHYLFSYRVLIENQGEQSVQLLRRRWNIFDSNGETREVEGEGVVGQQPVIEPGAVYEYESACNLKTDMGRMYGTYMIQRVIDGKKFEVHIPEFQMIVPYRLS